MSGEPVIVTYVEMRKAPAGPPPAGPPPAEPGAAVSAVRAERPNPDLNRVFYSLVGEGYRWLDRSLWTAEQWTALVTADEYQTWLGYLDGSPIGYFELDTLAQPSVEVSYFGLLPAFVGQGLGRAFLRLAIDAAWRVPGTERVWLHTCTDDHPRALPNYLAAGFSVYDRRPE